MTGSNNNEETSGQGSGALPLAQSIGSRNLIIAIITMPLVFMVVLFGTILIFGKHDRKAAESASAALPAIEAAALSSGAASALDPAPLILPAGADIQSMALDGDRLVLRTAKGDGEGGEIIVYDLASGAPVTRIPVIRQIAPDDGF